MFQDVGRCDWMTKNAFCSFYDLEYLMRMLSSCLHLGQDASLIRCFRLFKYHEQPEPQFLERTLKRYQFICYCQSSSMLSSRTQKQIKKKQDRSRRCKYIQSDMTFSVCFFLPFFQKLLIKSTKYYQIRDQRVWISENRHLTRPISKILFLAAILIFFENAVLYISESYRPILMIFNRNIGRQLCTLC